MFEYLAVFVVIQETFSLEPRLKTYEGRRENSIFKLETSFRFQFLLAPKFNPNNKTL